MNIKRRLDWLEAQNPEDDVHVCFVIVGAHHGKLDAPVDWINYGGGVVKRMKGETQADFEERARKTRPETDKKYSSAFAGYYFDEQAYRQHFKNLGSEVDEDFIEQQRKKHLSPDD